MEEMTDITNVVQQSDKFLGLYDTMQSFLVNKNVVEIYREDLDDVLLQGREICFYRVEQLSFDEDYPRREAFENILMSLNTNAFNFVYILEGTKVGINLYIGVVKNRAGEDSNLSANNYGETIANAFEGNFCGSKLTRLKGEELKRVVIDSVEQYSSAGAVVGVPSVNEKEDGKEEDFQGIDRLINSMLGLEWRLVVVCEPVPKQDIISLQEEIYEFYNQLSICAKMTMQTSVNSGESVSFGTNSSDSRSKNIGTNESHTTGSSKNKGGSSSSSGTSSSHQTGTSEGISEGHSDGTSASASVNNGKSQAVTVELANKRIQEMMKYIDEELLERVKRGFGKGLFETSVYYMAENPAYANRLKVGIMSLFQGNKSSYSPLVAKELNLLEDGKNTTKALDALKLYQNRYEIDDTIAVVPLLYGRPHFGRRTGISTYLTGKEVSLLAGLPQKEVPGLVLKEGVDFGLNEKELGKEPVIPLGNMVQKGRELVHVPFHLTQKSLAKHTFIAGVTGTGKTTTCHKLLKEAKVPFLVIEPAKTEYRTLINNYEDLTVFTIGNETVAPFRLNPFELVKGEVISSHIDMVKATFTSAFPMEASMPQLLEEAIINCYKKKGWNLTTNENEIYEERAFEEDVESFPILSDLLEELKSVVETKGFGAELQANYVGSLVSRLSNLTMGSKGEMLNCPRSVDFEYIAKHNVVLELEELKNPEDKSLLMGFVLTRLASVVKNEHAKNKDYRHITLIEEAHRLLSKVDYGDSGSKKNAVETFTDLLAEVRKYGEGLVVVDQIPNKLAPEVLKNTNTKIIHKILAKDDKEAVGDTMMMDDKQKEFLSALAVGQAIVFTENTDKPVHVAIKAVTKTDEEQIKQQVVASRFERDKAEFGMCYREQIIQPYYETYLKLCKSMTDDSLDNKELLRRMQNVIRKLSEENNVSEQEVWSMFIRRGERLSGGAFSNPGKEVSREERLYKFFTETIVKDDFDTANIEQAMYNMLKAY